MSSRLNITKQKQKSYKMLFVVLLCLALLCYVIYHLLHGNRGLLALFEIQKIVSVERGKLNDLESEVALLAHRVALLRPQSLDKDMLDERVRDVLNLAQSTEIIIDTNEILLEEDKDSG